MIDNGNTIGSTQFAMYIRGKLDTECNGFTFPVGQLRDFDLKPFIHDLHIPQHILQKVLEVTENRGANDSVNLSCLFHRQKARYPNPSQRIIHGWVLTEGWRKKHQLIAKWVTGRTHKSYSVVYECLPYIVEDYQEKVS